MEEAKTNLINTTFRRASLTTNGGSDTVIERDRIPVILNQLGQAFNLQELNNWLDDVDPRNTGQLGYDAFNRICRHFLKDPACLAKFEGDDFAYKHLIRLNDFNNP